MMRKVGGAPSSSRRLSQVARHLLLVEPLPCAAGAASVSSPKGSELLAAAKEGEEEAEIRRYLAEGVARANELGNRGPWRAGPDGRLAQEIVDAYNRTGFYVFEDLLEPEEVDDLRRDFEELRENGPIAPGSKVDRFGRPVRNPEIHKLEQPLTDKVGGTKSGVYNWSDTPIELDRHQLKMREPPKPADAPEWVETNMIRPLLHMDANLRVYGHPKILQVAEAINGPDFTPFTETVWIKPARVGTPTSWHQDVSGAFDKDWGKDPNFSLHAGGFSFHVTLYDCTAENGLWVVPGTHFQGRVDQKALLAAAGQVGGEDRLPGAVPVLAKPGDVYMTSRQVLHGSFANTGPDERVTLQFGFHRRADVLGIRTKGYLGPDGKSPSPTGLSSGAWKVYDEAYIEARSRMIPLAIDCRRQRYPQETPYVYQPFRAQQEQEIPKIRWSPKEKAAGYGNYWEKDLII